MSATTLPVTTVQPTLGEVLQEIQDGVIPDERFWVSSYKTSEPSVHSKINAELDELDRDLVRLSPEGSAISFDFVGSGRNGYEFSSSCPSLGISDSHIFFPSQEYTDTERTSSATSQRITGFDIAPDVSKFATAHVDGSVYVYPTSPLATAPSKFTPKKLSASQRKIYARPHLSEVTSLKFFPSSRVLLSSGLDFTLAILPADLPDSSATTPTKVEAARVLRGHTRAITGTAMIDVGRHLLSSSLDGTVKLWDVPSASVVNSVTVKSPVRSMVLGSNIYCGLESGAFEVLDISTKASVYRSPTSASPLDAISSHGNLLATGSHDGRVSVYDTRSLAEPMMSFIRRDGAITDLAFFPTSQASQAFTLAVTTSDGLPFVAKLGPDGALVADELVGIDCDPVRNVRVGSAQEIAGNVDVWLSCDDGVVRRYAYSH